MPFLSEKQKKLCWYKYNLAISKGEKPTWDCHKWAKHTSKKKKLPTYKSRRKSQKRIIKKRSKTRSRK